MKLMEQKKRRKISLRQGLRICPGNMSITDDNEHQEKAGGPQLRQRHHGNSLRKYYECKSRPWEDRRDV
ncbi:hypothetical protein EYF80_060446 [Liparis tanakae]|uniref:Uncharacterized protein n=1 Tax=Liparis tanakae TaxID=230148 RepID=A0A4Z2EKY1_9TELE|nr:hypothetical protein EYF80_060446 [Liparis tanakae]